MDNIEHVIVLMMENRSFDHFLGAVRGIAGLDGVSAANTNLERPGSAVSHAQAAGAVRKLKPDPKHETLNVLRQINGDGLGPMGAFVYDFAFSFPHARLSWPQAMAYFDDGELPALHALAKSFCVCDRWFSSVPGPTWTNRFFAHSGTSQGWVSMIESPTRLNLHRYDQDTIYDRLNERNVSWRIYAGDIPQSLLMHNQRRWQNLRRYRPMFKFFEHVAESDGTDFPAFTFIEPRYMVIGQNDQHPPSDVLKGDDLIASVYNAVRSNAALWESTLLVVTWDEHGGFYDHVVPPAATPPDHKVEEGFAFDRYGVRVPAVLVSKWVKPGSLFRPAAGVVDHTSILRYLIDKHGLGPLTNRVASAASLAGALVQTPNLNAPPSVGLAPRAAVMSALDDESPAQLNANQVGLVALSKQLEVEAGTAPADIGLRSMRARANLKSEAEVATERVWAYIERAQ
jgi:phospholipase C